MYPFLYESLQRKFAKLTGLPKPAPSAPTRDWGAPRAVLLAVLAITLGACLLRLYATSTFKYSHPDETIAVAVVSHVFQTHDDDTNWARTDVFFKFKYDQYNFSSYYLFIAAMEKLQDHAAFDLLHPTNGLLRNLRTLSAILGGLCALFAGILGWRMGGRTCAITASALTACSVTLFQDSLYARPETFVTLVSLLLCIVLTSEKVHRGLVLAIAGFLVGILVACKITFLLYFPFPLLLAPAFLSTQKDKDPGNPHLVYWSGSLGAYFLAMGIGFYVGAPYAVKYPWEYLNGLVYLFKQYEHGLGVIDLSERTTLLERLSPGWSYLVYTMGYPMLALSVAGIVRLATYKDVRNLLVMAGPLLSLLYFLQTETFFERNFSQALPMLFILTGMGIQSLVIMIKKSESLRLAASAVLLLACVLTPLSVMAKVIDPALDGRYQESVDAKGEGLAKNDGALLFTALSVPQMRYLNRDFCGNYIYQTRYFGAPQSLDKLKPTGYRMIGQMESPFGDFPISTLQTYLAPSVAYMTRPHPTSGHCALELAPLKQRPGETAIPTHVTKDGGWILGGANAPEPSSWQWPIYGSWSASDDNIREIQIGPFRACGDFLIPLTAGRDFSEGSLTITKHTPGKDSVLFEGLPPISSPNWEQLTIHQPARECAIYTLSGKDNSSDARDWMGLGVPVALKQ